LKQKKLPDPFGKTQAIPMKFWVALPSAHNEYRMQPPKQVKRLGDYNNILDILGNTQIDIVLIATSTPRHVRSSPW